MRDGNIIYPILKDIDKVLNHLNFWLVQIDSIMSANTSLKDINNSLNLLVLEYAIKINKHSNELTEEITNIIYVEENWDIISEFGSKPLREMVVTSTYGSLMNDFSIKVIDVQLQSWEAWEASQDCSQSLRSFSSLLQSFLITE